jgi:acyl dehydratase
MEHDMVTTIDGIDGIRAAKGQDLGATDWLVISQDRVNGFADATDDHQWIHVDVERATAESPFGGPIAHGFLTLSMASAFLPQLIEVTNISMGINYGMNKVRFPSPVPVGAKLRASVVIADVEEVSGGVQVTFAITMQVEGAAKPACVAEFLARYYP